MDENEKKMKQVKQNLPHFISLNLLFQKITWQGSKWHNFDVKVSFIQKDESISIFRDFSIKKISWTNWEFLDINFKA